jgi:hypothetical protein
MDLTLLPHSIKSGGISYSNDSRTTALIGIMSMSKLYPLLAYTERPSKCATTEIPERHDCAWEAMFLDVFDCSW